MHSLIHWLPVWCALAVGVIGLQRAVVQTILTTAAGATAQVGDVFALPQDWSSSDILMYQYVISGGTFTSLHVKIEASLDGVNFPVANVDDTTATGNIGVLQMGTTLNHATPPFLRAELTTGVVNTGSPIVTLKIWKR